MNCIPLVFVATAPLSALLAQCPPPPTAAPFGSWAAPSGTVSALAKWDPDGQGPLGVHVVCGGTFRYAGTAATENVALFNPATRTFSALGAGFDGAVRALAVLPNGTLVAGGEFTHSGGTAIDRVARWTGSAWVGLGAGVDNTVWALLALPNGDLVAGGWFTIAGGVVTDHVAVWNGQAWAGLGGGVAGTIPGPPSQPLYPGVKHLGRRPNGDLVIAGEFSTAGAVAANGLAVWNGTAWSSPLPGPTLDHVLAMHVLASGDVLVSFDDFSSHASVAHWDGFNWTQIGSNLLSAFTTLGELANGTLVGTVYDGGNAQGRLMHWNGTAWVGVSAAFPTGIGLALLEVTPGDLWVAMLDFYIGGATVRRWDGSTWTLPAPGIDQQIDSLVAYGDGFAIGGAFTQVGSTTASGIALLTPGGAVSIGDVDGYVGALTVAANGDLVIGGMFQSVGGTAANAVARYDGVAWHDLAAPLTHVWELATLPNGDLVAAGFGFNVMPVQRWNGTAWTAVGYSGFGIGANIASLVALPNGDVVVGLSDTAGPKVHRWNGSSWSVLGSGLMSAVYYDSVDSFCVLPNGDLVAGGHFTSGGATNVARWDGQAWQPMGAGLPSGVADLDVLPGGDVLATHWQFDDFGQPVASPSRWNGVTWTPIAGIQAAYFHTVERSAVNDNGLALVTGTFQSVQGVSAGGLALLASGCPATSLPAGNGCVGSAGPVQLSVLSHAWLGSTYRARTTGLPALAIAVQVFGLTSVSLPLATVLPSFPGCTLHVSPDVLLADLPTAGAVIAQWALPNSASLLGQSFRQQTVPFELAASGAITAVSASNAVQLTIGAW